MADNIFDHFKDLEFPEVLDLPYGLEYPEGFTDPREESMYIGLIENTKANSLLSYGELLQGIQAMIAPLQVPNDKITMIPSPHGLRVYAMVRESGTAYVQRLNDERKRLIMDYLDSKS